MEWIYMKSNDGQTDHALPRDVISIKPYIIYKVWFDVYLVQMSDNVDNGELYDSKVRIK